MPMFVKKITDRLAACVTVALLLMTGFVSHVSAENTSAPGNSVPGGSARGGSAVLAARGVVFEDKDHDGARDASEPGLVGVRVSNGVDIVTTDEQGRYEIQINADDAIIFVLKPRGYRTLIDEMNIPRFYYIHRPDGAPNDALRYPGVGPTGDLPASVDFPLYEQEEPERFDILLTADPQPYTMQEVAWYAQTVLPEYRKLDVAFAITLGDIVGDNLDLHQPLNEVHAQAGYPFYYLPGNHDLNYFSPDYRNATATYESKYGPPYYAFQYGPVHFITLHNMYWKGHAGLLASGHPRYDQYRDHLTDEQLAFVKNYVAGVPHDQRVVLAMHAPLLYSGRRIGTPEVDQLMELLSDHPHTASFSGHSHLNLTYFIGEELGYTPPGRNKHLHYNMGSASGSIYRGPMDTQGVPAGMHWDGTPRGYVIATFDGSEMSYRYKAVGRPDDHQMLIHLPHVVAQNGLAFTEVQVNVFAGSEASRTRMRVDGYGDWMPMQQVNRTDPAYERLKKRTDAEAKVFKYKDHRHDVQRPFATDHHWVATLPAGLKPGVHTVEVETTDSFGQTWYDVRTVRVVDRLDRIEELDYYNIRRPSPLSR